MLWGLNEAHLVFLSSFFDLLWYFPYLPCEGVSVQQSAGRERFAVSDCENCGSRPWTDGAGLNFGGSRVLLLDPVAVSERR